MHHMTLLLIAVHKDQIILTLTSVPLTFHSATNKKTAICDVIHTSRGSALQRNLLTQLGKLIHNDMLVVIWFFTRFLNRHAVFKHNRIPML